MFCSSGSVLEFRICSLATVTDAAGITTYAYNGTLTSGESIAGGLLDGLTLSHPQTAGRRQSFTATLGGDTVSSMGYGYDDQGRLDEVSEPGIGTGGFTALFGYVPGSDLPFTTTSKAGATTVLTGTRGYDAADRLTSIGYARPGNAIATSHGYILDAADRRTRATREDGTAWSYGYNDRDEVTSAVKLLPGEELLAGWQQTFGYDNLGNRKSTHEGGNAAGANRRQTVYAANALNQYTSITHPNAFDVLGRAPSDVSVTVNEQPVTRQGEFWRREVGDLPNALAAVWQPVQVDAVDPGAGPNGSDVPARRSGHRFVPMASETPFYDFDGNLVSDARWIYVWNAENQLIEMTTAAPALAAGVPRERYRFVYDSRSRRIARTVESWDLDAGAWVLEKNERFIHDDWNVVAVVDAAGAVVQRYAWGNDVSGTPQGAGGVGALLAAADAASGRSWCYAYDGNGNVSAVVDLADGAKVGRYDYDAFGRTIATWGDEGLTAGNVYRFSTKPVEGTGLYDYGYRWYEPGTGRWPSRDPIGERGGANLFGFVENRPIGAVDLLGRHTISVSEADKHRGRDWIGWKAAKDAGDLTGRGEFEYGGVICSRCCGSDANGKIWEFMNTGPTRGGINIYSPFSNSVISNGGGRSFPDLCPQGWIAVGSFHSHPPRAGGPSGWSRDRNHTGDWRRFGNLDNSIANNQNFANNPDYNIADPNQLPDCNDPEYVSWYRTEDAGERGVSRIPCNDPYKMPYVTQEPEKPPVKRCSEK